MPNNESQPIQPTQHLSGSALTLLRDRLGPALALALSALLFAATLHLLPERWSGWESAWPGLATGFLAGLLLGLLRLRQGSLLLPIALAGGWLWVELFLDQARLLRGAGEAGGFGLLAGAGSPRDSAIVWALLGAGILLALARGRRPPAPGPTGEAPRKPGLAAGILRAAIRWNPFSNITMLAPLDVFLPRLLEARLRVHPLYWPRLLVTLGVSAATTLAGLPERLLAPRLLAGRAVPPPLVIVGCHRSGTTRLQELLALDPRFAVPRTWQVFNPTAFLSLGWLFNLLAAALLPWRRPMDAMEFSAYAPNEDEFALLNSSGLSPYWAMVFPREADRHDRAIYAAALSAAERARWAAALRLFLRKLGLVAPGRPLLKSPYHLGRVRLIAEAFPGAQFIHIRRDPAAVVRSNRHLEETLIPLFRLQTARPGEGHADRLLDRHYLRLETGFAAEAAALGPGRVAALRFEDLMQDPMGEIARLYAALGLDFPEALRAGLARRLAAAPAYRPNRFPPPDPATRRRLAQRLGPLFALWGYPPPDPLAAEAPPAAPAPAARLR